MPWKNSISALFLPSATIVVTSHSSSPVESSIASVESLSLSAKAIPDCYAREDCHGLPVVPSLSLLDLKDKQRADPVIREVIHQMETGS